MQKPLTSLAILIATVIALLLAVLVYQNARKDMAPEFTTPYQAVVLVNGQAFFGRLENINSQYPVLRDVFYIQSQTNPETKQVNVSLVKRGGEWHAPDRMILNKQHVLLIEPVKEDSKIAKLIEEQSRKP